MTVSLGRRPKKVYLRLIKVIKKVKADERRQESNFYIIRDEYCLTVICIYKTGRAKALDSSDPRSKKGLAKKKKLLKG